MLYQIQGVRNHEDSRCYIGLVLVEDVIDFDHITLIKYVKR